MPQIDYFLSTISPFTYLAGARLEEVAAKHGATITYKPFDIGALFPRTGGTPLPQRHPSHMPSSHRRSRRVFVPGLLGRFHNTFSPNSTMDEMDALRGELSEELATVSLLGGEAVANWFCTTLSSAMA